MRTDRNQFVEPRGSYLAVDELVREVEAVEVGIVGDLLDSRKPPSL